MNADDVGVRLHLAAVALAAWLAAVTCAWAQDIPGYPKWNLEAFDPREVAMLPKFCIYTHYFASSVPGGDNQTIRSEWEATLGPTFIHLHHYCFGLMKTNRAVLLSRDAVVRRFYLTDSITEFDYVIDRAPADFVLLPEILTKRAQNFVLLGKGPLAVLDFRRAIDAKNDYWPPYAYLSDYYVESGDTKKAAGVLQEGLSRVPAAKALQRRLDDIGQLQRRKKSSS